MKRTLLGIVLFVAVLFFTFGWLWIHSRVGTLGFPRRPLVFVLSIDAFRHDFIRRPEMVTLRQLASDGVHGPMIPQFPSFTFTNHYSLMTGLYPRVHGIVGNKFYDADMDQDFAMKDAFIRLNPQWWLAEPLWITANRLGLRTATMFWPGDEIWRHPLHQHLPYQKNTSYESRIAQVFRWLDDDPELSLCTLYFSLIDDTGHKYGPEGEEMDLALERLEGYLKLLLQGLRARHLQDRTNLIILSDHGIQRASSENSNIYIDQYVPELAFKIRWMDYNVVTTVFPHPGEEESVFEMLSGAVVDHALPMRVMWTDHLPADYHFKPSSRIGPIIIIANPGYTLARRGSKHYGGFHGYEAHLPEMNAFFLARGPSIDSRRQSPYSLDDPINSLDVYPLLAELLAILPRPNNGTRRLIEEILA